MTKRNFLLADDRRTPAVSSTRPLATRYFVSLAMISLLGTMAALLIQYQGRQSQSDTRLVNIAGRQRMLSQAIAKKTLLVARSGDLSERLRSVEDLRNLYSLWERSHSALTEGDPLLGVPGTNSLEVQQMFSALDPHYNAMVGAARALVAKVSEEKAAVDLSTEVNSMLAHEGPFLEAMNAIVLLFHPKQLGMDLKTDGFRNATFHSREAETKKPARQLSLCEFFWKM